MTEEQFLKYGKLIPGTLIINFGDVHIYQEHVDVVKEQLDREPYKFPKLHIKKHNLTYLHTAIDNLIRNGLKYNDSESKFVEIFMEDNILIIQDNGRGMSQEEFDSMVHPPKESSSHFLAGWAYKIEKCSELLKFSSKVIYFEDEKNRNIFDYLSDKVISCLENHHNFYTLHGNNLLNLLRNHLLPQILLLSRIQLFWVGPWQRVS